MTPEQVDLVYQNFEHIVHHYELQSIIEGMTGNCLEFADEILKGLTLTSDVYHNNRCILFKLIEFKKCNFYPQLVQFFGKPQNELTHNLESNGACSCDSIKNDTVDNGVDTVDGSTLRPHVKFSTEFYDTDGYNKTRYYKTRSRNRGRALILNNIEFENNNHPRRDGADIDERCLQDLFEQLGFQVVVHRNLSAMQMYFKAREFSQSAPEEAPDICAVIIMSHGGLIENKTVIVGSDNQGVYEDWFKELFNNERCSYFRNKPKIFIFHVCRDKVELPLQSAQQTDVDASLHNFGNRIFSDMMICHPSVEGFLAHRDAFTGCWYIQLICKVFSERAHELDVESMLKIVDEELEILSRHNQEVQTEVKVITQTSTYQNIAFKTCYIHPGIYEDNGNLAELPK